MVHQRSARARGTERKQKRDALLKCALNVGALLLECSKTLLPIPGTSSVQHPEENEQGAIFKLTQEEYDTMSSMRAQGA